MAEHSIYFLQIALANYMLFELIIALFGTLLGSL